MLISFHCSKCRSELEGESSLGGSEIECPQCGNKLTVPCPTIGPGVTLGGFEIIRLLGEGGMGEVYLAKQLSLGREVALKILPARMKIQSKLTDRFFQEIKLLARLEHPNIVTAYEAGEDEGILFLAMAYVDGTSLQQKLCAGSLKESEALEITRKLADALAYAWDEHHLIHRDIKPANIMLTARGEVKLMDFGLAKCLRDEADLTLPGTIMGSPNYMSPEQVDGKPEPDYRSDHYSLGAALYHMLTGKLPFEGSSITETLRRQATEDLPDPRTVNPEITSECVALLEIMLSKNRDLRHRDYTALLGDINRVKSGAPPMRKPLNPGESVLLRSETIAVERLPERPGRHRLSSGRKILAGSAAALVSLLLIGAIFLSLDKPKPDIATHANTVTGSDTAALSEPSVVYTAAILDFDERGAVPADSGAKVTGFLFEGLSAHSVLHLVERSELNRVLAEHRIALSRSVTTDTAERIGRFTGAKMLITGSVIEDGANLHLLARLVGVETTRVLGTSVQGAADDGLKALTDKLAERIAALVLKEGHTLVADSPDG